MSLEKESPLVGYEEVSTFIDQLAKKDAHSTLISGSPDEFIQDFIERSYEKKIPLQEILIKKIRESNKSDHKVSLASYLLAKSDIDGGNWLRKQIKDKKNSDALRKKLLLALEKVAGEDSVPEMMIYFQDKELVAEQAVKSLLKHIRKDGRNLEKIYPYLLQNGVEFHRTLIGNLIHRSDDQSLWLLATLAELPISEVSDAAIQALSYRKSSLAYEILDNLVVYREEKKELAEKALKRVEKYELEKIPCLFLEPYKCYLGQKENGEGGSVIVSRKRGKRRFALSIFFRKSEGGFGECSHWPDISFHKMESILKRWGREESLEKSDYDRSIALLEDTLWHIIHVKKEVAPSFLIARRIFGEKKLAPQALKVEQSQ